MARFLGTLLLIFQAQAFATTFIQQPFSEAVGDAPVVVRGRIGHSLADWVTTPEGQKRIYTYYELQVSEVFKGLANGKTLAIRELGGVKNGLGMQVAGAAQFAEGEDVVVFLNDRNADGSFDVRGMMMGKYGIQKQADGKETLLGPGLIQAPGNGMVTDDAGDQAQGGPSGASPWTLDRLRQLVDTQKANPPSPESSRKPRVLQSATPVASAAPMAVQASNSPAPGLQPLSTEEAVPASGVWTQLGLPWSLAVLIAAAAAVFLFRRK